MIAANFGEIEEETFLADIEIGGREDKEKDEDTCQKGQQLKTVTYESNEDVTCGFSIFKGPFLQRFANETSYVIIYGIVGCFLSMTYAYSNGTISTLEKRFKIPSKVSGVILVGNDISQMLGSVFVGYYASKGHRPRWMGFGLMTIVVYCFLTTLPHFLYGAGDEALKLTKEFGAFNITRREKQNQKGLCSLVPSVCFAEELGDWLPILLFFLAQLISGVGGALYYTLGLAYMDDNTTRSKTAAMLSGSAFLRMLGPACGYTLVSFCLRYYIAPSLTPLIKDTDPRWLGAWWMGWLFLGFVILILGTLLMLFPKELPSTRLRRLKSSSEEVHSQPSLNDMLESVKRLIQNKIYVYNNLGSTFYVFGYMAYWMYTPKYIEVQYRQSAATSSMVNGSVALAFSAAGILISGFVISKYKPSARAMATWNILVDLLTVAGCVSYVFIGCAGSDNMSLSLSTSGTECSSHCNCDYVRYSPVCGQDNVTYISPCHAGCNRSRKNVLGQTVYEDCSCVGNYCLSSVSVEEQSAQNKFAIDGTCPVDCFQKFMIFLAVMCCVKLIGASARSTNLLIALRCVATQDKTLAMGLGMMQLSLFTLIPSPIFFGWLLDNVCLVWGKNCSSKGNCWLYDTKALRYQMNIVAASFILVGSLFNFGVWKYSKNLQIFGEEDTTKKKDSHELERLNKEEIKILDEKDTNKINKSNEMEKLKKEELKIMKKDFK